MCTCSLLAVGDELLDGRVQDTNSDLIAEKLSALGMKVVLRSIVGDDLEHIASVLRMAMAVSQAVVVTGGLGPTEDDITREAVARTLGLCLRRDASLEESLRGFFSRMGREMSRTNLKQADILDGAVPMAARLGTAPGQWVVKDGGMVVLVPGVPREMRDMLESDVVPLLTRHFKLQGTRRVVSLVVAARPESELAEEVRGALEGMRGIGVSYRAMMGQIEVKLAAHGEASALEEAERRLRSALGPWVVAEGQETLEGNLGRELTSRGLTLAVAESLTGGMVGERITRVPGSSHYFLGGVVAYTLLAKEGLLGVDGDLLRSRGSVCAEVVEAMARGVREMFSSRIGIALSGVAGPGSGGESEPPGTVAFGLADAAGTYSWKYRLPGNRDMVREFATTLMLTITYMHARGEDLSHAG